ncbi:MAG TPA: DNA translocase FtsK 4TM domain-containing protein, partial [Bacillota bacterium]|nr:DNA translocase FtsK 4TM domain-containing protein [Bacillota bacterium]
MARRTRRRRRKDRQVHNEVGGLIIAALAILAGASLFSPDNVGQIGAFLARLQWTIAGEYALFIPFSLLLWGIRMVFFPNSPLFARRAIGSVLIILCILTAVHIAAADKNYSSDHLLAVSRREPAVGGGILGALGAIGLLKAFGLVGGVIILISVVAIGLFLLLNISLKDFVQGTSRLIKSGAKAMVQSLSRLNAAVEKLVKSRGTVSQDKPAPEPNIHDYQVPVTDEGEAAPLEPVIIEAEPLPDAGEQIIDVDYEDLDLYQLPPLSLLQKTVRLKDPQGRSELVSQVSILEETLASFGIEAKVINVHRGPTITRFEIQPASGVKVSRIVNLADDLALNLAATGVRIEAPIPGKSAVGLEVANKYKATVYLREVLETSEFLDNPSKLAIALGKDIAGAPVIADLTDIPHVLIAGATGSGKSVCLNSIIISLLYKAKPSELKFLMIDPKVVELNVYNGLPHLLCPVIT